MKVVVSYQTLDILQEHGIAANDIQKLNAAGFHTVESVRTILLECHSNEVFQHDDTVTDLNCLLFFRLG